METTEMRLVITSTTQESVSYYALHILGDNKGREIGARITRSIEVLANDPTATTWQQRFGATGPGVWFCYRPQAMRGRLPYGAGQPIARFASEAARDQAIGKYLAAAEKRAAKIAAGKGSRP
jgi:hypothetical protein